jgi:hypothetical protein
MHSTRTALFGALALLVLAGPSAALAADTLAPVITHQAVREATRGQTLTVSATITDDSEIFEPTLYYRAAGTKKFQSASMSKSGSTFSAAIPEATMKGDVEYFIEAYDAMGNGPARFASDAAPQRVKAVEGLVPPPPPVAKADPKTEPKTEGGGKTGGEKIVVEKQKAPDAAVEKSSAGGSMLKPVGYAVAGVGVAGLAAGGLFLFLSSSAVAEANADPVALSAQQKANQAGTYQTMALISFVAGGVLAAGGLTLALLPGGNKPAAAEPRPGEVKPDGKKDKDVFDSQLFLGPTGASYVLHF